MSHGGPSSPPEALPPTTGPLGWQTPGRPPRARPADPGTKADGSGRATGTGCALPEATRDEAGATLQPVIRHRRGRVAQGAARNCPARDHPEAARPGAAACFDKRGESPVPWHLLRHYPTAAQLRAAGVTALGHSPRRAGRRWRRRTARAVIAGAERAAPGDVAASQRLRIALALADARPRRTQAIRAPARHLAGRLAQAPDGRSLSCPGINAGGTLRGRAPRSEPPERRLQPIRQRRRPTKPRAATQERAGCGIQGRVPAAGGPQVAASTTANANTQTVTTPDLLLMANGEEHGPDRNPTRGRP